MTFQQWLNQIIDNTDYLTKLNTNTDFVIRALNKNQENTNLVNCINFLLEANLYKRYYNFTLLYDSDYTYTNLIAIINENLAELAMMVRKYNLAYSTLLDDPKNYGNFQNGTNQNTMSYSGLNVEDNYQVNNSAFNNTNLNYLGSLIGLDIDFKKIMNVMRDDFEKLFQVLYNVV